MADKSSFWTKNSLNSERKERTATPTTGHHHKDFCVILAGLLYPIIPYLTSLSTQCALWNIEHYWTLCKLCVRLHWTVVSHSKLLEILNQLSVDSPRGLESRRCERPSTALSPRQWLTRAQARPIQVRCPSKSNMQFIVSGHGISKAGVAYWG